MCVCSYNTSLAHEGMGNAITLNSVNACFKFCSEICTRYMLGKVVVVDTCFSFFILFCLMGVSVLKTIFSDTSVEAFYSYALLHMGKL